MRLPAGYVALAGRPHFGQLVSFSSMAGDGYMAADTCCHEYPGKGAIFLVP